jgi:secondary thiamine-phosphate synthase enzyme
MRLPTLEIPTRRPQELVDVTDRVRGAIQAAGVRDGFVVVFCPHTTAGVTIQEHVDPDVQTDLLLALEQAVPDRPARGVYRHAEGNSPAHVKSALVGSSATVIIDDGDLLLGTWQGIFLCEFDGPRPRKLELKIVLGSRQ